jgi:hypothetical protein
MAVSLIAIPDVLPSMSEPTGYGGLAHRNPRSREVYAVRQLLSDPLSPQVHRRLYD